MRSQMFCLTGIFGCSALLFASIALASNQPAIENAAKYVDKVFIPMGFDDNDNVEVIISGHLPNTCYRAGQAKYTIDEEKKSIVLDATVFNYSKANNVCFEVMTPFMFKVSVGILNSGKYNVVLKTPNPSQRKVETLDVTKSNSPQPDDYLYAPVQNISGVQVSEDQIKVSLEGTFPYMLVGCMVMKDVMIHTKDGVVVVQPIAELISSDEDERCVNQKNIRDFVVNRVVPYKLDSQTLLHVRVMNGLSVNQVMSKFHFKNINDIPTNMTLVQPHEPLEL